MDWEALLRSSVTAAIITGIVAVIGFWVSAATARKINEDKLALDEQLANQKAAAELALAERRVELERALSLAKRRAEVAEKVLADFYRIRKAFEVIRSPAIWAHEQVKEDGVPDDIVQNEGYGIVRRVRQHAELFSELEATRPTFGALFGHDATAPYDSIIRAHNQVFHAAESLVRHRHQEDLVQLQDFLRQMRRTAFAGVGMAG